MSSLCDKQSTSKHRQRTFMMYGSFRSRLLRCSLRPSFFNLGRVSLDVISLLRRDSSLPPLLLLPLLLLFSLPLPSRAVVASSAVGLPCVFEGHLKTDKNWFGYLANVSVVTTARMTFEFSYAADRCCQNVLFYTEDQTSIINARMNCWQKEYLLRPEDDQILRLTPRFSWSGCHMTHPGGLPTYHCEGGRSFTVESPSHASQHGQQVPGSSRPSAWYIAASNCAALNGLDLRYRLVVYGHVGDCPAAGGNLAATAGSSSRTGGLQSQLVQNDGTSLSVNSDVSSDSSSSSCQLIGDINTTSAWHGFISNMTLSRGGGFKFQFRFQAVSTAQIVRVLLYRPEDIIKLSAEQTCWQKDGIIRHRNEPDQVIDLSAQSSWNGCISSGTREISCQGERRYDDQRRLHVALSDCHSTHGIQLHYQLDVHGYSNHEELCSAAPDSLNLLSTRTRSYFGLIPAILVTVLTARTRSLKHYVI